MNGYPFLASLVLLLNSSFGAPSVISGSCSEGDLRLDNTTTPSLSLVMICVQGQWGYVCGRKLPNSPWTKENVGVACQQLGLIREDDQALISQLPNKISNVLPVHYRFVQCTGVEKRLIDCAHGEYPATHLNCRYKKNDNDIEEYRYGAVRCSKKPIVCEAAGELKIINNSLAMCSQGEWYTLCGNTSSWTQAQARVACRQMGLNPNGAKALNNKSEVNMMVLSVLFHCKGGENSLSDCSSSIVQDKLSCHVIAAVECGDSTSAPQNLTATLSEQNIITISWDHNENDAEFLISCSNDQFSISTTTNGTTGVIINLPLDSEYKCCVMASTIHGESESVCESITVGKPSSVLSVLDNTSPSDKLTVVKESVSVLASKPVGEDVFSSSLREISSFSSSTVIDHLASSSTSSSAIVPWSVGLIIGIVTGAVAIIIIWIGQILICRKKKSNSMKNEPQEISCDMVTVNPTYDYKQEEQTPPSQPFPGSETKPLYEPVYTDADNLYSEAQDDAYSLALSNGSGCCTTEKQGYSVVKINNSEDLYQDLSNAYTD